MAESDDRWERLIQGLRSGDAQVAREFWEQYGDLLHGVAEKHLADGLRRRVGPEDVVQSVCRTFLRRAQGNQFQLADSEQLWHLLCAITLNKIRQQARFHQRQKRGLAQEMYSAPDQGGEPAFEKAAPGPSPSEAAEFADQFQLLFAALDEEERQILELKLQDYTHEEVAQRLGCSERTVRRVVKRLQSQLARTFDVS